MPGLYHCALWNTARFFAPLVGSRLSNSPIGEGMWRHAANCRRYVGQPCKDSTPMFMTFPTNSGLTLMSKWVLIHHHRRLSGKWPFFRFCNFFTTMFMGKEWNWCFNYHKQTKKKCQKVFSSSIWSMKWHDYIYLCLNLAVQVLYCKRISCCIGIQGRSGRMEGGAIFGQILCTPPIVRCGGKTHTNCILLEEGKW